MCSFRGRMQNKGGWKNRFHIMDLDGISKESFRHFLKYILFGIDLAQRKMWLSLNLLPGVIFRWGSK